jgi:hypothetical protein
MQTEFHTTLRMCDGSERIISGNWTAEQAVTLNRFLDQYEELADSRPMIAGVPCEVQIHVRDGQAEVTTTLPSQDDLDILFQRLRLFVHQKERTYFDKVCGILKGVVRGTPLLKILKEQQRLFQNRPEHVPNRVIFNGVLLSDENRLNDWIYGYQYHGYEERRAVFESHGIDVRHPAVRRAFVGLLLSKRDAIVNVASIAAVFMGRNSQFAIADGMLLGAPAP